MTNFKYANERFYAVANAIIDKVTGDNNENVAFIGEMPDAQALSALGASKGGKARAKSLTAKKRKEIAGKAAKARW